MSQPADISDEEFRQAGERTIGWIAHYLSHPDDFPVLSRVAPGEIKSALPESPPRDAEPLEQILADFEQIVVPGITHWNHPRFFAYFSVTASMPGILGELLSAALNVNCMLWQTSPAATELEQVSVDWLRQILGIPAGFDGVIMDTASVSTLCAIAAARHAQADLEVRERGMAGRPDLPQLRLYTSEQAHSSVDKAAIVLGLGKSGLCKIATDDRYQMKAEELERAVGEDESAGHRPFCVVATVGTTSTTSIDPVPRIAEICQRHGLWLHVDAAYGGAAATVPEYRHVLDGCGDAMSIVVNPHKWFFTPIDCSVLYTRRPGVLTGAFSVVPEYLRTGVDAEITNFMDWGVSLGRRFRALKLWMVLRAFGSDGIAQRIREHIRLARLFADWVDEQPDFERLAPTPLSVVCFRARPTALLAARSSRRPSDAGALLNLFNEELLRRLNAGGEVYLSHTKLDGRYSLRLAVGNLRTTEQDVRRAWDLVQVEATALLSEPGWVD